MMMMIGSSQIKRMAANTRKTAAAPVASIESSLGRRVRDAGHRPSVRGMHYSITSGFLRGHQVRVGNPDQRLLVVGAWRQGRQADADRQLDTSCPAVLVRHIERMLLDALPDTLRQDQGVGQDGVRSDDRELLPTITRKDVGLPQVPEDLSREFDSIWSPAGWP